MIFPFLKTKLLFMKDSNRSANYPHLYGTCIEIFNSSRDNKKVTL